jgi:SAM-dependent methyltransferase
MAADVDGWIAALQTRHRGALTNPEFLKAVRALSARYVERRGSLPDRSPLDSTAKRAAFAAFYGPLHFLTVARIVDAIGAASGAIDVIGDLGCGTGVSSAAWALAFPTPPRVVGVDVHAWALDEAAWTWQTLRLSGRARRADVARARLDDAHAIVAAWSVNELDHRARAQLLARLIGAASRGASVLIVEPIGRRVTPWWPEWSTAFEAAGGRSDEWRFESPLPPVLAALDEAAGFRRDALSAKTLWLPRR